MTRDEFIEFAAAACHAAWYAYTVIGLGEPGSEWQSAPAWQRASIRNAVEFWLRDPHRRDLERASHENWKNQRQRDGWTWGPTKDIAQKQSPCLVEYDELPSAQRLKDQVVVQAFRAVHDVWMRSDNTA